MSTSITAPLQSSRLVANPSAHAASITLPENATLNMTGLPLPDGTLSNFTVYAWIRWTKQEDQAGNYYDIFTSGPFHMMWTDDGRIFACFSSVEGPITIGSGVGLPGTIVSPEGLSFADGNWHALALSYAQLGGVTYMDQYPSGKQLGQFWLYVDGDLWETALVSTEDIHTGTPSLTGIVYPALSDATAAYSSAEIATLSISTQPVANDEASLQTVWGKKMEGNFVVDFDFANGGATDESGNGGTALLSNQQWSTPCLQSSMAAWQFAQPVALFPDGTDVNPGGSGDFSVMGWIGFPETIPSSGAPNEAFSIALFTNTIGDTSLSLNLSIEGDQMALNLTDGSGIDYESAFFPRQDWSFVALTFDATTYQFVMYVNGKSIYVGKTAPNPWWNTSGTSTALSVGSVRTGGSLPTIPPNPNAAANLQGLSFWSVLCTEEDVKKFAHASPSSEDGCVAFFPLTTVIPTGQSTITAPDGDSIDLAAYSLKDSISGIVLLTNNMTQVVSVQELNSPCLPSDASPRPAARFAKKEAEPSPLMTYADHLRLAKQLGIDLGADPSEAMKADPDFKANVDWYESLLKDVNPKLAAKLRGRFARNLSVGKQLGQKIPGIGAHTFERKGDTIHWMYQSPSGKLKLGEMAASPGQIVMDVFNILISGSSIITSIIGVYSSASALKKGAEKLIPPSGYGAIINAVSKVAKEAKKEMEQTKEIIMTMIEFGLKVGDIGGAIWAYMKEMSWWDIIFVIGGIILWLVSIIATAGGAAFLAFIAKLAMLIQAVGSFIKDVIKLVNDLKDGGSGATPNSALA